MKKGPWTEILSPACHLLLRDRFPRRTLRWGRSKDVSLLELWGHAERVGIGCVWRVGMGVQGGSECGVQGRVVMWTDGNPGSFFWEEPSNPVPRAWET